MIPYEGVTLEGHIVSHPRFAVGNASEMVSNPDGSLSREQPIFSARAHVFQIDPTTKRNWIPASKHAVNVSFFYDANRSVYRIISVSGTKVRGGGDSLLTSCDFKNSPPRMGDSVLVSGIKQLCTLGASDWCICNQT